MCDTPTPPGHADYRALYDIRVKEMHHYNTLIWAFPGVYAIVLINEYKDLFNLPWAFLLASIFNCALIFAFYRHMENKQAVCDCLKATEKKVSELYGSEFVPKFNIRGRDSATATQVITFAVTAATAIFLVSGIIRVAPCHSNSEASKALEPVPMSVTDAAAQPPR
jgi:hypothetical protein